MRKLIEFDDDTFAKLKQLARDRMATFQELADEAIGTRQLPLPDGSIYDIYGEWTTISMYPSLSEALGPEITPQTQTDELWALSWLL